MFLTLRFAQRTTRVTMALRVFLLLGGLCESGVAKDVGKMAGELKDVPKEFQVWQAFLFSVLCSFFFRCHRATPYQLRHYVPLGDITLSDTINRSRGLPLTLRCTATKPSCHLGGMLLYCRG